MAPRLAKRKTSFPIAEGPGVTIGCAFAPYSTEPGRSKNETNGNHLISKSDTRLFLNSARRNSKSACTAQEGLLQSLAILVASLVY